MKTIINILSNYGPLEWFVGISILTVFGLFISIFILINTSFDDSSTGSAGDKKFKFKVSPYFFK